MEGWCDGKCDDVVEEMRRMERWNNLLEVLTRKQFSRIIENFRCFVPILLHNYTKCSQTVHKLFTICSQNVHKCSQNVHKCSQIVHKMFTKCSQMFTNCSKYVHKFLLVLMKLSCPVG